MVEQVVGLRFVVDGEQQATAAIKRNTNAVQENVSAIKIATQQGKTQSASLDRVTREVARAERELRRLSQAQAQGRISQGQLTGEMNRMSARLRTLGLANAQREVFRFGQESVKAAQNVDALNMSIMRTGGVSNSGADFLNQFGEGARVAGVKTNKFGMYAQQVGYQVGDFFVQIQSGTNAFVAFGQQATQLAGLLPGLAGAIVGIGISVATTFLAAWSRTRDAVAGVNEEIAKLSDTISMLNDVQRTTADGFEDGLNKAFEGAETNVARLLQRLREAEFAAAMGPVKDVIDEITVGIDQVDIALDAIVAFDRMTQSGQQLDNVQKKILEDARQLVQENLSLAIAYDDIREAIDEIGKSESTRQLVINFAEALGQAERLGGPVASELVSSLLSAAKEAGILEQVLSMSEEAAKALSEVDMDKGIAAAAGTAAKLAKELGVSLGIASRILALGGGREEPVIFDPRDPRYDPVKAEMARLREGAGSVSPFDPSRQPRDVTGGTGGAVDEFTSRLLSGELLEAIKRAQEETALYEKEVQMLDSALSSGLITQMEYNSYVQQAKEAYGQASQGAYDYEKAMEQVSNTAMSSMEDAFMSILDGSKSASDAFKDMARAIIAEAMRMLVIRPLLQGLFGGAGGGGGFLGGLLNANGNAFIGGNVTAFANGGVVGGPTMFPMSGGRTGLMGEAGPEAIMPLKRTSSGKLGVVAEGGGAVTVNNNIHVQGDNPAAIRQEIAKLMPTITEATKAAVIDARRRGGQMRAAFS